MQFKVPQFIDIEDKLFGDFTFRQFVYMVGGAGIMFVLYKLLPFWIALVPMILVALLAGLLTFFKINNKPFVYYLQAGIAYAFSNKLYLWKQRLVQPGEEAHEEESISLSSKVSSVPIVTENTLRTLSWNLDIQEKESGSSK